MICGPWIVFSIKESALDDIPDKGNITRANKLTKNKRIVFILLSVKGVDYCKSFSICLLIGSAGSFHGSTSPFAEVSVSVSALTIVWDADAAGFAPSNASILLSMVDCEFCTAVT